MAEFSRRTKVIGWIRCGGNCEGCTANLYPGKYHFHHRLERAFEGTAELENLQVLCIACHSAVTGLRAPVIAKSNRVRAKHAGIRKPRRITAWRRFNGDIVIAPRQR